MKKQPSHEQISEAKKHLESLLKSSWFKGASRSTRILLQALEFAQLDSQRLDIIEDIFSITDDEGERWKNVKLDAAEKGWRYAADELLKLDAKLNSRK